VDWKQRKDTLSPIPGLPREANDWGANKLIVFKDDDAGYLAWVKEHPLGYVLNTTRPILPDFLILHLASCRAVSGKPGVGNFWTAQSIKVCAEEKAELVTWAETEAGGQVSSCNLCNP